MILILQIILRMILIWNRLEKWFWFDFKSFLERWFWFWFQIILEVILPNTGGASKDISSLLASPSAPSPAPTHLHGPLYKCFIIIIVIIIIIHRVSNMTHFAIFSIFYNYIIYMSIAVKFGIHYPDRMILVATNRIHNFYIPRHIYVPTLPENIITELQSCLRNGWSRALHIPMIFGTW